jgi:CRP-like cAMP-binding protein
MIPIKTESAWRGTSDCQSCGIRAMVLFSDLNQKDFESIHTPIDDLEYRAGHSLYRERDQAQNLFTIRSGTVKLLRMTGDGQQRILRLLRPGDVAGLESLTSPTFESEAVAMTSVTVCRIPVGVIHDLSQRSPRLHAQLMKQWHQAVKQADDWLSDINFGTASRRVRQFILKMRHTTDPELSTLFSREEMGAMMGLKLETVSREISALRKAGIIAPMDKLGRMYRILNPMALAAYEQ